MLLRAAKEGVATHVVSVNWSSTLLRAALAAPAEPQPPPPPGSRQQEAVSSGGAVSRDSQDNGATESAPGPQSAEDLIQQQLGPEVGLSEEDKEAPVPETAAAYQVPVYRVSTSDHTHNRTSHVQSVIIVQRSPQQQAKRGRMSDQVHVKVVHMSMACFLLPAGES